MNEQHVLDAATHMAAQLEEDINAVALRMSTRIEEISHTGESMAIDPAESRARIADVAWISSNVRMLAEDFRELRSKLGQRTHVGSLLRACKPE